MCNGAVVVHDKAYYCKCPCCTVVPGRGYGIYAGSGVEHDTGEEHGKEGTCREPASESSPAVIYVGALEAPAGGLSSGGAEAARVGEHACSQ